MAGNNGKDRYAAPNRETTLAPGKRQVRFVFWNYCAPDNLDSIVKTDIWNQIKGTISNFTKEFLNQIFSIPALDWLYIGHDSRQIQPMKGRKDWLWLFRGNSSGIQNGRNPIFLPDDSKQLYGFADDFIDCHYLHIYRVNGKVIEKPVIVTYRSQTDWDIEYTDKNASHEKNKNLYSVIPNDRAFVIPLPFRITKPAQELLKDLIQSTISHKDHRDKFLPFYIEFNAAWLKNNKVGNQPAGVDWWYIKLFSPFHILFFMARTLAERQKWIVLSNPSHSYQSIRDHKSREVRYRAIFSGMMKQIAATNGSVKSNLDMRFVEHDFERYNFSFRTSASRLLHSIEYLLDSWLILKLEDLTNFKEEMESNGAAWIGLMRVMADTLRTHEKGTQPFQRRRAFHRTNKMHSPIIYWMDWMIDPSIAGKNKNTDVSTKNSTILKDLNQFFWKNEKYLSTSLKTYDTIFDAYVNIKSFDISAGNGSYSAWNKELDNAAKTYQKNLGLFYKAKETSDKLGRAIGYAGFARDLINGKLGSDQVKAAMELGADLLKEPDKNTQRILFRSQLFLRMGAQVLGGAEASMKSYDLWKRGDYNAMAGGGLVVASSGLWIGCAIATGAAPSGPIGWIIGALALAGNVIILVATDSDLEILAKTCVYRHKNHADASEKPDDYFKEGYKNWPIFEKGKHAGLGYRIPDSRQGVFEAYRSQLNALLAISYKIDSNPDYSGKLYYLRVKFEMGANPVGTEIRVKLVFSGKKGRPTLTLYAKKVQLNKRWSSNPVKVLSRDTNAPNLSKAYCEVISEKNKWIVSITGKVTSWEYHSDFKDGYIEIYPNFSERKSMPCPMGSMVRRVEPSMFSSNYPSSLEVK